LEASGRTQKFTTKCPFCNDTRKKHPNQKCFTIWPIEETYNCNHCHQKGNFKIHEDNPWDLPKRVGTLKPVEPLYKRMAERGIDRDTVDHFKMTWQKEWKNRKGDTVPATAVYNFFEGNTLMKQKFKGYQKDGEKIMWSSSNSKHIFYGQQHMPTEEGHLIITEGEDDAMSWRQCGVRVPAWSVDNGSSLKKIGKKLECFDNISRLFQADEEGEYKITKVYISTDDDPAGLVLKQELIRRLRIWRCYIIEYPEGCKDANEVLHPKGPLAGKTKKEREKILRQCFLDARPAPSPDVQYLENEIWDDILNDHRHGLETGISTGSDLLDQVHLHSPNGSFEIWTGIPEHGKGEFLRWVAMMAAVKHDWKSGWYVPEDMPSKNFYRKLSETYIGKPFDNQKQDKYPAMTESELIAGMTFVKNHFFTTQPEKNKKQRRMPTLKWVIEVMEWLVLKEGIRMFVIDPFNGLDANFKISPNIADRMQKDLTEMEYQAMELGVKLVVVMHPNKMEYMSKTSSELKMPGRYHVAGGAMPVNKCHTMAVVHRETDEGTDELSNIALFRSLKQKNQGIMTTTGQRAFEFVPHKRRYIHAETQGDPLANCLANIETEIEDQDIPF